MSQTPEERYDSLAASFHRNDQVRLGVNLPGRRVDELVESGEGERFDAGKGEPMREWFSRSPTLKRQWPALAREAKDL